jgi:hypothetical protein
VRALADTAAADVAHAARRRAGARALVQTVSSDQLQINFSQNFQTKVHKSLNTNVTHQTTLYKFAKGSRVFCSLDLA